MWNACTGSIFHVCDCSVTSLNSQSEWGKSISLRCMRKGSVESVMLEVFEFSLLTLGYLEDLDAKTSAVGCISISFLYVSASENANIIIRLFRKHVINISLIYFFCWSSALVSAWIFPKCWQLNFFFSLATVTYVLSFFWKSQIPAVCVNLLLETTEYGLEIKPSLCGCGEKLNCKF